MALLLGIPLWSTGLYSLIATLSILVIYKIVTRLFSASQEQNPQLEEAQEIVKEIEQSKIQQEQKQEEIIIDETNIEPSSHRDDEKHKITPHPFHELQLQDTVQNSPAIIVTSPKNSVSQALNLSNNSTVTQQFVQEEKAQNSMATSTAELTRLIDRQMSDLARIEAHQARNAAIIEANFNAIANLQDRVERISRIMHNIPQPQAEVDRAILSASPQDPIKEPNQGM
jgi:hypothetical protein